MQIGRTIIVALLAVAIGMLPASVSFATTASASGVVGVSATQAMPDCAHHQHDNAPSKQTQKPAGHDTCLVGCALCFGFVGANIGGIDHAAPVSTALKPLRAFTRISSLMGNPPFRPPRA